MSWLTSSRYNRAPQYFLADFDIRILIGSADMKFQILADDKVVSMEHDEVQVIWDNPVRHQTDDKIVAENVFGDYQELG